MTFLISLPSTTLLSGLPGTASPCGCAASLVSLPIRLYNGVRTSLPVVDNALNSIQAASALTWEGPAASAYQAKLSDLRCRLQAVRDDLAGIAALAAIGDSSNVKAVTNSYGWNDLAGCPVPAAKPSTVTAGRTARLG